MESTEIRLITALRYLGERVHWGRKRWPSKNVEVGLLATVFMELYPLKIRLIENILHDSSVRHAPFDMGYRGIVSTWDNHYEDFKQLTTWRPGGMMGRCPQFLKLGTILQTRNYRQESYFSIRLLLSVSLPGYQFYVQLANDAQYVRKRLDYPPGRPTFSTDLLIR